MKSEGTINVQRESRESLDISPSNTNNLPTKEIEYQEFVKHQEAEEASPEISRIKKSFKHLEEHLMDF